MAKSQAHNIQRFLLELNLNGSMNAEGMEQHFNELVRSKVLDLLQAELDLINPKHGTLRIERLELDVGDLPADQMEQEFPVRFVAALRKEVERFQTQEHQPEQVVPEQHTRAEALAHFLKKGAFPWWFSDLTENTLDDLVQEMLRKQSKELTLLLRSELRIETARKRFFEQLSLPIIKRVVQLMTTHASQRPLAALETIATVLRQRLGIDLDQAAMGHAQHELLLHFGMDEQLQATEPHMLLVALKGYLKNADWKLHPLVTLLLQEEELLKPSETRQLLEAVAANHELGTPHKKQFKRLRRKARRHRKSTPTEAMEQASKPTDFQEEVLEQEQAVVQSLQFLQQFLDHGSLPHWAMDISHRKWIREVPGLLVTHFSSVQTVLNASKAGDALLQWYRLLDVLVEAGKERPTLELLRELRAVLMLLGTLKAEFKEQLKDSESVDQKQEDTLAQGEGSEQEDAATQALEQLQARFGDLYAPLEHMAQYILFAGGIADDEEIALPENATKEWKDQQEEEQVEEELHDLLEAAHIAPEEHINAAKEGLLHEVELHQEEIRDEIQRLAPAMTEEHWFHALIHFLQAHQWPWWFDVKQLTASEGEKELEQAIEQVNDEHPALLEKVWKELQNNTSARRLLLYNLHGATLESVAKIAPEGIEQTAWEKFYAFIGLYLQVKQEFDSDEEVDEKSKHLNVTRNDDAAVADPPHENTDETGEDGATVDEGTEEKEFSSANAKALALLRYLSAWWDEKGVSEDQTSSAWMHASMEQLAPLLGEAPAVLRQQFLIAAMHGVTTSAQLFAVLQQLKANQEAAEAEAEAEAEAALEHRAHASATTEEEGTSSIPVALVPYSTAHEQAELKQFLSTGQLPRLIIYNQQQRFNQQLLQHLATAEFKVLFAKGWKQPAVRHWYSKSLSFSQQQQLATMLLKEHLNVEAFETHVYSLVELVDAAPTGASWRAVYQRWIALWAKNTAKVKEASLLLETLKTLNLLEEGFPELWAMTIQVQQASLPTSSWSKLLKKLSKQDDVASALERLERLRAAEETHEWLTEREEEHAGFKAKALQLLQDLPSDQTQLDQRLLDHAEALQALKSDESKDITPDEQTRQNIDAATLMEDSTMILHSLHYFLVFGRLPWWSVFEVLADLEKAVAQLQETAPDRFREGVSSMLEDPWVNQRLTDHFFPEKKNEDIAAAPTPQQIAEEQSQLKEEALKSLQQYLEGFRLVFENHEDSATVFERMEKSLPRILERHLSAMHRGTADELAKDVLAQLLELMSLRLNIAYDALLDQVLEKASTWRSNAVRADDPEDLKALKLSMSQLGQTLEAQLLPLMKQHEKPEERLIRFRELQPEFFLANEQLFNFMGQHLLPKFDPEEFQQYFTVLNYSTSGEAFTPEQLFKHVLYYLSFREEEEVVETVRELKAEVGLAPQVEATLEQFLSTELSWLEEDSPSTDLEQLLEQGKARLLSEFQLLLRQSGDRLRHLGHDEMILQQVYRTVQQEQGGKGMHEAIREVVVEMAKLEERDLRGMLVFFLDQMTKSGKQPYLLLERVLRQFLGELNLGAQFIPSLAQQELDPVLTTFNYRLSGRKSKRLEWIYESALNYLSLRDGITVQETVEQLTAKASQQEQLHFGSHFRLLDKIANRGRTALPIGHLGPNEETVDQRAVFAERESVYAWMDTLKEFNYLSHHLVPELGLTPYLQASNRTWSVLLRPDANQVKVKGLFKLWWKGWLKDVRFSPWAVKQRIEEAMQAVGNGEALLQHAWPLIQEATVEFDQEHAREKQEDSFIAMPSHAVDGDKLTIDLTTATVEEQEQEQDETLISLFAESIKTSGYLLQEILEQERVSSAAGPSEEHYDELLNERHDWTENQGAADKIYLDNAGLILVWPFLPRFFNRLGFLNKGEWTSKEAQERAVHVLQYLLEGKEHYPEYNLMLNKLLCGMEVHQAIKREISLTDEEKEEADLFLKAVISQWTAIKNTPPDAFQKSFFQREGVLYLKNDKWNLKVEARAYDLIFKTLPWGMAMARFSWMKTVIFIEWKP